MGDCSSSPVPPPPAAQADEAKRAEQKKNKEERLRQRKAQALLLAKAAAEADQAQEGVDEDEIENIVDVKKGPLGLVYEIKWKGYERPEDNTWEPEGNLCAPPPLPSLRRAPHSRAPPPHCSPSRCLQAPRPCLRLQVTRTRTRSSPAPPRLTRPGPPPRRDYPELVKQAEEGEVSRPRGAFTPLSPDTHPAGPPSLPPPTRAPRCRTATGGDRSRARHRHPRRHALAEQLRRRTRRRAARCSAGRRRGSGHGG